MRRFKRMRQIQQRIMYPPTPLISPVPPQRYEDVMSAWGQLNGTEFIRCAVTEFDTYGFIPRALRARFAKVVGDVLRRVNQSQGAARDQALRWFLAIPQLFLRRTCYGAGRRVKRQIEGRLDQWERRDFCKLVGDWKHDISVHQPPLRKAEANSTPAILRALTLIEEGEMSRGVRLLYSTAQGLGIADAASEEVLAQLKAKHPLRRRHVRRFSTYRTGKSGPVPVKVAKLGRKLRRRVGVGPDGWRNEHIRAILAPHGDVDADETPGLLDQYGAEWAGGVLPDWYYHLALAARLAALIKRKVGRLQVTPVRPIGVGSAMTRLVCAASVQYFEGVVHRILYPLQVAVGVKGSGPKIVFGMRGMVERFGPEGGVLRKVDVVNAFQEFDREDCLTVIDNPDPEFVSPEDAAALRELFPLAWQMLSVAPALYLGGEDFAGFHSQSGGTQGNPLTCLSFCLSAHSSLLRAQRRLKAAAPWAVVKAQMDDGYLFGPADVMDAVEADLRADLKAKGMKIDAGKWQNYALPDERRRIGEQRAQGGLEPWLWGAVVRAPGVGTEVGELQYTAVPQVDGSGGVLGYGLHAQGVPMGDRGFVQWELKRLAGKAVEKVRQCRTVLASMPSKQFHLHTVNLYCFSPLLDHLIQSCCPEDVQEALRPFDDAILTTAKLALGLDLADQIALRRARLPPSRSGLLLRQRGGHGDGFLPDAAFWGVIGPRSYVPLADSRGCSSAVRLQQARFALS
jgi:hypothetical protein